MWWPDSPWLKVRDRTKIRNRYNQVPKIPKGKMRKHNTKNIQCKRAKRSALSQQMITRLQEIDITILQAKAKVTKNDPQKASPWTVTNKITEGLI